MPAAVAEDAFEKIAEEAIRKAEAVRCSKEEFIGGLKEMVEFIQDRLSMEKSFQRNKPEDDDE